MTNTKKFYAVEYANGVAISAETGKRYLATYHSFPSATERDEWIEWGGDFRSSSGWREAVKASDSELRAEIRLESNSFRSHEAKIVNH